MALVIALIASLLTFAQDDAGYTFLVAGHAYGAHAGTNIGLHPPFLSKLQENKDVTVEGLFLTGDIVNTSTAASWAQVDKELSALGVPSYYIMGNHDNNTIGKDVFIKKYGGLYYYLNLHNDLFVILNSTASDRSISSAQLAFLTDVLQTNTLADNRVFIFFHEVIWNSDDKYQLVRSNSRSRYDQIRDVSNFWQQVVPILDSYPEKNFYLFSGDVGGNPDAIAAFYDRRGNMTLLSSGMGEVPDENYLKVNVSPDTVTFDVIALDNRIQNQPVTWYSIPAAPPQIIGPKVINPSAGEVNYEVSPVFNADAYQWTFTGGITGNSNTASALLSFDSQYQTGQITVKAVKDGFGESAPVSINVNVSDYTAVNVIDMNSSIKVHQNSQYIHLTYTSEKNSQVQIRIYNLLGKLLFDRLMYLQGGFNSAMIDKNLLGKGVVILDCKEDNHHLNKKIFLY